MLVAVALTLALAVPQPSHGTSEGQRLIKRGPSAKPLWMNSTEVDALVRAAECGGGPHHPKPGFIDVGNDMMAMRTGMGKLAVVLTF
eukprot:SAG31_NODE_3165_length_4601_cov_2.917814_7_plen_87_part_00